jgi:serine/threonine protein kinase
MSQFHKNWSSYDWQEITNLFARRLNSQLRLKYSLHNHFRHVGRGGSSTVFAAATGDHFGVQDIFAVKMLEGFQPRTRDHPSQELRIMQSLKHNHIVALVGSFIHQGTLGVLMYPLAECNLAEFLQEVSEYQSTHGKQHPPHVASLLTALGCLSSALQYLHVNKRVKHKDIKPENILVDSFGSVLLADFGISKQYRSESPTVTEGPTAFTQRYAAPEVAAQKSRGLEADIFSLGCVFLELATVILGESILELQNWVFHSSDCESSTTPAYHRSLPRVKSWIARLKHSLCRVKEGKTVQDYQNSPNMESLSEKHLNAILSMMSHDSSIRPTIENLHNIFGVFAESCTECSETVRSICNTFNTGGS